MGHHLLRAWLRPRGGTVRRPDGILQTSAMDCGPAALAALLSAHGISANVDVLRGVCVTDIDGTSVDALEEIGVGLGLEAEQLVVPLEQVLACPAAHLPALVLTLTPDGYVHFVTAWRVRRGHVDLVDPAIGHRSVRRADFLRDALTHELIVDEGDWAEYALGEEARTGLLARLTSRGMSLNAARRRCDDAIAAGSVEGIGALLDELAPSAAPVVERVAGAPRHGPGQVRVRAAVIVRAPRTAPSKDLPAALATVVAPPPTTPARELRVLLRRERRTVTIAVVLSVLAGLAAITELLAAQRMLDRGATAGRLLGLLAAVATCLVLGAAARSSALAAGRRTEHHLRTRLLDRVARLGDGYVRSRPTGDLAERGHATVHLRTAIDLAAWLARMLAQGGAAVVAMIVLAPATWPVAIVLLVLLLAVPLRLAAAMREPELRARTMHGAISLQLTDVLGAGATLRGDSTVLRALHAPLLALRDSAAASVQRRLAVGVGIIETIGLVGAGAAAALARHAGMGAGAALVVGALAFTATSSAQEVALVVRRWVPVRSALGRLLEPLSVPLTDPPLSEGPALVTGDGVRLALRDVTVRLGARDVLSAIDVTIEPGEHVAVVGPSGAGKSSLAAVLAGWVVPTAGTVEVDGEPLRGDTLARLRRTTAWSDATTRIHDDTLAANADHGSDGSSAATARLTAVGLDGLAQRLGDGAVGHEGRRLTAVEVQRLRLARAMGRTSARLVLLDEALSDLPPADQHALLAKCRDRWPRATMITITHNVRTAVDFDRVLVVDDGRIIEDGAPKRLAADPASALHRMLAEQQALRERLGQQRRAGVPPIELDAVEPPPDPARGFAADPLRALLGRGHVIPPAAFALALSVAATLLLADAAGRLDRGTRAEPTEWVLPTLGLLAVAGMLTGLAAAALGRASVALGSWTRRRALSAAPLVDDRTLGARVGLVLDLEHVESTALGAGATLSFALVETLIAFGALLLVGRPAAAAVLVIGLAATLAATLRLTRVAQAASTARSAATAHLVDRMLSLRTVTLQEDPSDERVIRAAVLSAIAVAQSRVDRLRVAVAAIAPRATIAGILVTFAVAPPLGASDAAAALGATLLALTALDRIGIAAADLAPAAASARSARTLLGAPAAPTPGVAEVVIPPATVGQILHQPLAANALLATRTWPPSEATITALQSRLDAVGLGSVIHAMPLGLGQPLGETGWRLSQGERARLLLVRGLMADAPRVTIDDPTSALDPATAMRVLDALEDDPRVVIGRQS